MSEELSLQEQIKEWNNTATEYPNGKCIHQLFEEQVDKSPDAVAIVFKDKCLTYKELNIRSNRLAHHLRKQGIKAETLVAICVDRSLEMLIGILGTLKAGGTYVPLDPDYPKERIKYILENSGAKIILTKEDFKDGDIRKESDENLQNIISSQNSAYVIYTSGSTGKPKGVQVTHESVIHYINWCSEYYYNSLKLPTLLHGSAVFDMAVTSIYLPLFRGEKIVINPSNQLEVTTDLSVLKITPSHLYSFSEKNAKNKNLVESLIIGGESLSIDTVKLIPNFVDALHIYNEYGPTETTVACAVFELSGNLVLIGQPISNTQMYILDEKQQPLPIGTSGEIYIGGVGLARGYLNRPDLTAEKFIADPFGDGDRLYRTGDLGRYLPDGNIEYLGRIDNQVKIRGFRIELGEIEATINCCKDVRSSVVLARSDESGHKHLIAYVIPKNISELEISHVFETRTKEEIVVYTGKGVARLVEGVRKGISNSLPEYMIPSFFVVLDKVPLTLNGKMDGNLLLAIDTGKRLLVDEYMAPQNEIEEKLCEIWKEVLQVDEIGINDNFFKIGGDSLRAIKLVNQINVYFFSDVKVSDIFEQNTIATISKIVEDSLNKFKYRDYLIEETSTNDLFEPFELTNVQQAYYFGRQGKFELGNISTHAYYEYLFTNLDVQKLEFALNKLIDRHYSLRTVFKDGYQQFLNDVPYYAVDFKQLHSEDELIEIRNKFSHKIYDMTQYPLFDIFVSKLNDKYILHFSYDVLLIDGNSFVVFFDELTKLYQNSAYKLPKLSVNYKGYIKEYVQVRESTLFDKAKDYWNVKLDEYDFEMNLPLKIKRYNVKEPKFSRVTGVISKEKWENIEKKAESFGVSATSVILMIYGEILCYWTSQKKVCVNMTLFNRLPLHPQINDILGDFTVLELFDYEKSNRTISEKVKAVHDQLWMDIDNNLFDGIDFQRLIREKKQLSNDMVLAPIVLTSLGNNLPGGKLKFLNDSFCGTGYSISQTSQVYIDNKAYETSDGFVAEWDYVEQLFDQSMIESMHKMYCSLLEDLSEIDWEKDSLPKIVPPNEDTFLIEKANSEKQEIDDLTIVERFEKIASKKDVINSIAVVDDRSEYTYGQLLSDTEKISRYLTPIKEELIGILSEKGYNQVVSTLSIMKSGHGYLPLYIDWPEGRIEEILLSSGVKTLLVSRAMKNSKRLSEKFHFLIIEDLLENAARLDDIKLPKTKSSNIAYVIYTSGSTGKPKGVTINHVGAINTIDAVNRKFSIDRNDVALAVSELSFDLSVYDIFGLLFAGGKIIFPKQELSKDMKHLSRLILKYKVTIWNTVPQLADLISDEFVKSSNHDMRLFLLSGDRIDLNLPSKLQKNFPQAKIYSLGGATEGSIWSIWYEIAEVLPEWNSIPYGKAMPNQKMYVMTEDLEHCAIEVKGEIHIGGIGVAIGYWKDEKLTKRSFINHQKLGRLYKTGDLGRWSKSGYIEFCGRKDTQLKLNGYRVELGEIEAKISELNGIERAVVTVQSNDNNNFVVAYVVPESKFDNTYPENIESFKIEQHGIFHELKNTKALSVNLCEDLYRLRKSYRNFVTSMTIQNSEIECVCKKFLEKSENITICNKEINKDKLTQLLSCISAMNLVDRILPKYRYPSAGSTYSVRCFLNIPEDSFGIAKGYYYYNPVTHCLCEYNSTEKTATDIIRLDLIIHVPAIKHLYKESYKRYAYIEIGHMISLLQSKVEEMGIHFDFEILDKQVAKDDILAVSISFAQSKKKFINENIKINFLQKEGNSFKNKEKNVVVKLENYSIFTRAGEWDQLLSAGAEIISVEGNEEPANWIDAGIALQKISEKLYEKNLGSCMLGPKLYDGSIYSMIVGGITESDKLKAEDNLENVSYEEIIKKELLKTLPEYMIPYGYVIINDLPLSTNGKLDLKKLPKLSINSINEYIVPRTEIEKKLCEIWEEVLHLEKVGINDNFFKIGGHSLLATRIISKIRAALKIDVPLKFLFEYPTVYKFAKDVEKYGINENIPPLVAQEKTEFIPLSFAQQRLWVLDKLLPEKALYNIPYSIKLLGKINYSPLERAINKLIERHDSFRTNFFETEDGQGYQVISPEWKFKLIIEDTSEKDIENLVKEEAATPFDLTSDRLLRTKLLKIDNEDHVLLITMHHIISDGWSMPVFLNELKKLYNNPIVVLPKLPITYADYAIWQRSWLKDDVLENQLNYWKNYLRNAPVRLDLPFDYQRPTEMTYAGGRVCFELEKETYHGILELAEQTNTTLFMLIFAAVNCLLHKYTHQDDIVIGTPIANRHYRETEGLIGFFVNTLALRTHFRNGVKFSEILDEVKASVLKGYENQDIPFEYLVDKLNVERLLNVNPLFQVMVRVNKEWRWNNTFNNLKQEDVSNEYSISKFDLDFCAYEDKENLRISIEYSRELFAVETIERLSSHLQILLKEIAVNPNAIIDRLIILTSEEKQQLLIDWNNTAADYPKDKCIHELFEEQVEKNPEAVAVVYEDKHLTYRELNARSNQLANYLRKHGVIADTLVAICVDRSLEMIIGIMGILKSGGAYIPLDPTYPEDRLKYMMEDSGAKLVITKEYFGNEEIAKESADNLVKITSPQNLAYVIYTSGSTGKPKGVQITQNNIYEKSKAISNGYGRKETDICLVYRSFCFDAAFEDFFIPLLARAKIIIFFGETFEDNNLLKKIINKECINAINSVPAFWVFFNGKLNYLEKISLGGDSVSIPRFRQLVFQYEELEIFNVYGPSECTIDATMYMCTKSELHQKLSLPIGKPLSNTQIYILDSAQNPVPRGVSGEIYIGGVGLARGYLNRPDLTAEKFVANPFGNGDRLYRTGDLGRYLADGNIEFLERIDNQVKIRGFRIELGEIESAINESEDVKTSVVLAREDADGNKQLVSYVVPKSTDNLEESYGFETQTRDSISVFTGDKVAGIVESIRNSISCALPEYMIPNYFVVLDKIPLTSNGKTDSKLLLTLDTGKRLSVNEYVAPWTEMEKKLCEIWQEVLRLEKVGINDNFFKIGGHSLLATRIISKIRTELNVDLPLKKLFEHPTIATLIVDVKESKSNKKIPPLIAQEKPKNILLSFAQQRLWVLDKLLPEKALYNIPNSVRLVRNLDYEALERAINKLIERHESFRTNFFETGEGEGYQVISPEWKFKLIVEDVSEKDIERVAKEEAETPFNLTDDCLLRIKLLKIDNDDHVLLITMHHIISDGWSMPIFLDELKKLYNDSRVVLPKLPITYADYAIWQRSWLKDDVLENQLNYWKNYLQGIPEQIDLPYDYQRPAEMRYEGESVGFELEKETYDGILKLANATNTTVFMVIFAIVNCLLHRYTHQDDIVIGTPIANRHYKETEGLIGFFVNTLALRTYFDKNMTFMTVLEQVKKNVLSGYENQDVPFEYLVDKLNVERRLNVNPLFQVMVTANKRENSRKTFLNLEEKRVSGDYAISKFDLEFDALEEEGRLYVSIGYSKELFKRETIERLSKHMDKLLKEITTSPMKEISRINILTEREKQQLLIDWNDTVAEYPKDKCIHKLFEKQVKKNPDATAIVYEDKHLTYRELNERSNQLANYLRKCGVIADTLVAICIDRSLEMVVGMLGILKSGGAYVPLDPTYPEDRLKYMMVDSGAKLVITKEYFENENIQNESKQNLNKITSLQNLAYVIYTSGSTGKPKGVQITHRGIVPFLFAASSYLQIDGSGCCCVHSYAFDFSIWEIFGILLFGHKVVIFSSTEMKLLDLLNKTILRHNISTINLTPTTYYQLNNTDSEQALENIFLAGEGLNVDKLRNLDRKKFVNMYGTTETTVFDTCFLIKRKVKSVGRPISNVQIYILDDNQNPVPLGVSGEIYIGGVGLARGYLSRPDLTAEKFIANPFGNGERLYKTGDLGKYLSDGNIEFLGRIDNQVKIRGFRIELGEIESTINESEDVKTSVVLAREDSDGNKQLVTYIVPKSVNDLEESYGFETQTKEKISVYTGENVAGIIENIRNEISQTLPEYMIPSYFILLNKIPLTSNGKTDSELLLTLDTGKRLSVHEYVAPRTEMEKKLCEIWQEVLHLEKVGINDNFFKIGGHSLLAMRIISKTRAELNVDLLLKKLFEYPTVAALALDVKESKFNEKIPPLIVQEKPEFIPLSFAQQRLWILDKLLPEKALYNILYSMRLTGEFDYKALEKAINKLIERHESFRVSFFETEDGQGYQVISPEWKFKLIVGNISEKDIEKITKEEAKTPFSLIEHLLRIKLLKINNEDHVLLITMHHIISDGWSMPIFLDELMELYNDQSVVLPKLPITYADYAIWQRSWLKDDVLENQLNYWKNYLQGIPEQIDLPYDYHRSAEMTYEGESVGFELEKAIYDGVLKLAKETNSTVFMVMFAVVNCLLHRYTYQDDIVIGTPIANRHYKETEGLIGFFVNTLALRTHFDKDMTFNDVLNEVKKSVTGGYENQDIPFEYLVDKLNIERRLNVNPLFQIMVTTNKWEIKKKNFRNLQEKEISSDYAISKFDLEIDALEEEGHLYISIGYSKELFKRETIERLSSHLQNLFKEISVNPNAIIDRLIILTSEEKQQLLVDWNDTAADYPKNKCVHELFEEQVEKSPDVVTVVYEDKHLTYGELNERSNQLANYLRKYGVTADTLVAICVDRSLEMIIGIMGVLKAGGAYVPLDPTYPEDRLKYMMKDSGAKLVITKEYFENEKISKESAGNLVKITSPQNLAYVIYTSGTTGKPKGVQISHRNFINRLCWMEKQYDLRKTDRILQRTVLSFDLAGWEIFWPLLKQSMEVLLPSEAQKDPIEISKIMERQLITISNFVPSLLKAFNENSGFEDLQSMRLVISGGESLPFDTYHKVLDKTGLYAQNGYGPTEVTLDAAYFTDELRNSIGETVPIGRPISNMQIYILDSAQNPVPQGVSGEIYVSGVGLSRGYLNRPDLTAEKFIANPFGNGERLYRTGDLGKYLSDGNIEFLGRIDNQVKIRGFRIELGEIESAINDAEDVKTSVVLAREDVERNKHLIAYIVPESTDNLEESYKFETQTKDSISVFTGECVASLVESIRNSISKTIPEYMISSYFIVLNKIPLTPNGKTDSKLLLTLDIGKRLSVHEYVAPRTEMEKKLCEIWQEVLHLNKIGINDNFFKIGGDSILAIQLISKAKKNGLVFSVKDVFVNQTVENLSGKVVMNEEREVDFKVEVFETVSSGIVSKILNMKRG